MKKKSLREGESSVPRRTSRTAAAVRKSGAGMLCRDAVLASIPRNWCDSLLTGPDAVVGAPPFYAPDVERLLNGVRKRIEAL